MIITFYFFTICPYSFSMFFSNICINSTLDLSIFIIFCSSKKDQCSSDSSINELRTEVDFLKIKIKNKYYIGNILL